jgi:hypothetical protein
MPPIGVENGEQRVRELPPNVAGLKPRAYVPCLQRAG